MGEPSDAAPGAELEDVVVLRDARPSDLEWVVTKHAEIYGTEFGYDASFVDMVRLVAQRFCALPVGGGHRGWMATTAPSEDGAHEQILGSVFLVEHEPGVGQLRLLVLDRAARGRGVGRRLVSGCVEAARRHGYRSIVLETEEELSAARGLYRSHGFRLVSSRAHADWGRDDLVSEWWRLDFESVAR